MEKEKINIAELLHDCPTDMELDCTMYDDVYFDYVDELNIIHCYIKNEGFNTSITFNQHGTPHSDVKSKCVIFPKGKTTWKGFHRPFKDGDIIYSEDEYSDATFTYVAIVKRVEKGGEIKSHCFYNYEDAYFSPHDYLLYNHNCTRFATEEEKEKLFKVIKDNGYQWDVEKKTLEKLPRFKVGDSVRCINNIDNKFKITGIANNYYICENDFRIYFKFQENWELVPNKFDINTLVPFESKVLVRNAENQRWVPAFWGYKDVDGFITTFGWCTYCIPYEGNEHLWKTNNDCDDYFKTWQE